MSPELLDAQYMPNDLCLYVRSCNREAVLAHEHGERVRRLPSWRQMKCDKENATVTCWN